MTRHLISTALVTTFFLGALVLRPLVHRLRTGKWGLHGLSGGPASAGWWGGLAFIVSMLLAPVALLLPSFESPAQGASILIAVSGLVLTLFAQSDMGTSWRIGVRQTDRTALITTGLFALVRNPIFTGMSMFAVGLAALWPNVASFASLLALLVAIELQVRFVEEPYLLSVHGTAWKRWASRVGRFVPALGRVRW